MSDPLRPRDLMVLMRLHPADRVWCRDCSNREAESIPAAWLIDDIPVCLGCLLRLIGQYVQDTVPRVTGEAPVDPDPLHV